MRGTNPRDLAAVAAMHARCSARGLLDRYRAGGRAPSPVAIERALRHTLGFVACTPRGEIVAMALAGPDRMHGEGTAQVGILVEDAWQRRGLAREMLTHLSAAAYVCGYSQLISYTATNVIAPHRLLVDVGRTYSVPDPVEPHLHTYLTESVTLGLGPLRERLAS
jgi:GNAT superfamily N-acetyltransferase